MTRYYREPRQAGARKSLHGGSLNDENENPTTGSGFLDRHHHKLRFTELSETFFGRVILLKCPDPHAAELITLCDLFRRDKPEELVAKLTNVEFSEAPKVMESGADLISANNRSPAQGPRNGQTGVDVLSGPHRVQAGLAEVGRSR